MQVVRANGVEIAYERVGKGPPLAFVHGAAEDGRVWQPQLAALANEFTVLERHDGQVRGSRPPLVCHMIGCRERSCDHAPLDEPASSDAPSSHGDAPPIVAAVPVLSRRFGDPLPERRRL